MKSLLYTLERAQRLLAGDRRGPGWTGPEHSMGFCKRLVGESRIEPCWWDDEAVWQYTVEGALRIAAGGNQAVFEAAFEALRGIVAPSRVAEEAFHATLPPLTEESAPQWFMWNTLVNVALRQKDLREWLQEPKRTLAEVLEQFDQVILKLKGAQLQ